MRHPLLAALTLGALALGSCEAYSPQPDYVFHQGFVFGNAHADKGCDSCHVLAASQQDLASTSATGWVTDIQGATCVNCHPFVANLEDPTAFCPPDATNPLYDTEKCQYERAHPADPGGCISCHSTSHFSWDEIAEDGNPHNGALLDVFPLEGGHDGPQCIECHATPGQEQLEAGKGEFCGNCHGRVRDGTDDGVAHYPPARAEWVPTQAEHERDCRACHAPPAIDGTLSWPSGWDLVATPPQVHGFLVPHHTVSTWASLPAAPLGENEWKYQCWSCHNVLTNPTDSPTAQGVPPPFLELDFTAPTCTNGCHSEAHNTNAPEPCWNSSCHPQAGPNDPGTPPI